MCCYQQLLFSEGKQSGRGGGEGGLLERKKCRSGVACLITYTSSLAFYGRQVIFLLLFGGEERSILP